MPKASPLASVSATRAVLEAHGLATKKALGQHFLVNDGIVSHICELAEVGADDVVLEVGPGIGTLTCALLDRARAVVAVERDADLPAVLAETCAPWADRFALIQKDALQLRPEDLQAAASRVGAADDDCMPAVGACAAADGAAAVQPSAAGADEAGNAAEGAGADEAGNAAEGAGSFAVGSAAADAADATGAAPPAGSPCPESRLPTKFVANLPYAVAATLVLDYFERFPHLESATVMVQKEVADRMAASPGTKDYGAFTVKLALYAQPAGRFAVGPANFFPPPRVDSAVLRLDRRVPLGEDGRPVSADMQRAAALMADAAFANRRKTIANSCKTYFAGRGAEGAAAIEALPGIFAQAGIDPRIRGEALSVADFVRLGAAYLVVRAAGRATRSA